MGAAPPPEAEEWRCCFAVDTGNHDSASAIIRYASGVHAVYSQNFYARRTARGASLFGYRGTIAFDWCSGELTVHYHSGKQERHQVSGGDEEGHWGGDEALAREFLAAIRGVDARRAPLDAGILSAQLCLLARESSSANRFEEVQPLGALSSLALAGA
jgi:predicted dehydrogenase